MPATRLSTGGKLISKVSNAENTKNTRKMRLGGSRAAFMVASAKKTLRTQCENPEISPVKQDAKAEQCKPDPKELAQKDCLIGGSRAAFMVASAKKALRTQCENPEVSPVKQDVKAEQCKASDTKELAQKDSLIGGSRAAFMVASAKKALRTQCENPEVSPVKQDVKAEQCKASDLPQKDSLIGGSRAAFMVASAKKVLRTQCENPEISPLKHDVKAEQCKASEPKELAQKDCHIGGSRAALMVACAQKALRTQCAVPEISPLKQDVKTEESKSSDLKEPVQNDSLKKPWLKLTLHRMLHLLAVF